MDRETLKRFMECIHADPCAQDEVLGILEGLTNHVVPESFHQRLLEQGMFGRRRLSTDFLCLREDFIKACGYILVSYEWVRPLSKWIGSKKCLEIMAGSGCLTKALLDCGTNIIATDNKTWSEDVDWFSSPWTEVEAIDCVEAIKKYGKTLDYIICSWPYRDDSAFKCLQAMRCVNMNLRMIYIGEASETCATREFFDAAEFIEDLSFEQAVGNYVCHAAMHDDLSLIR